MNGNEQHRFQWNCGLLSYRILSLLPSPNGVATTKHKNRYKVIGWIDSQLKKRLVRHSRRDKTPYQTYDYDEKPYQAYDYFDHRRTLLSDILVDCCCLDYEDDFETIVFMMYQINHFCHQYRLHEGNDQPATVNQKAADIDTAIQRTQEIMESIHSFTLEDEIEMIPDLDTGNFFATLEDTLPCLEHALKEYRKTSPAKPM